MRKNFDTEFKEVVIFPKLYRFVTVDNEGKSFHGI